MVITNVSFIDLERETGPNRASAENGPRYIAYTREKPIHIERIPRIQKPNGQTCTRLTLNIGRALFVRARARLSDVSRFARINYASGVASRSPLDGEARVCGHPQTPSKRERESVCMSLAPSRPVRNSQAGEIDRSAILARGGRRPIVAARRERTRRALFPLRRPLREEKSIPARSRE